MSMVIPTCNISNQNADKVVAIILGNNNKDLREYQTNTFKFKIKLTLTVIGKEKSIIKGILTVVHRGEKKASRRFLENINSKPWQPKPKSRTKIILPDGCFVTEFKLSPKNLANTTWDWIIHNDNQ